MRGSLTGDFGKLSAFANRVEKLGSPATMTAISKQIADEALNLVQVGFVAEVDPTGKPWAPKKYPDGRKILRGTSGKLQSSFVRLYAGPDAAIIGSRARYAGFVQSGTGIYGSSHALIRPKGGKALKMRGPGGRFMFRKYSSGSPARPMMPSGNTLPPLWSRAIKNRVNAFLKNRLGKSA